MANIAIFRINYKSDFILTLESDAGWMTPFCIKFWTGVPSQAYFAGYDGTTYTHCAPVEGEPTKLLVQFDDHHLPIGDLKFQIGYHFTVADFPTSVEDEVINQAEVIIDQDGTPAQVMLDLNGETAPEIEFSLPAYANEAQRIANEEQRIAHEAIRIVNEESRIAAETIRQQNEAQRIAQETARVNEFATLKSQSQAATSAANTAAALANEKAQLAADKAALAGAAATLANAKAQLAADKAALADAAATLANDKAALAQQKAEYAQTQGDYAKTQGNYAKEQGKIAEEDHERAEADHTRAESDHTRAESDHAAVEVYVDSLGVFDLSKHNAVGGVLATYADLSAALTALNALDSKYKYGGMSFKFVHSSDNKYMQFRCTADEFTTDVTKWAICDEDVLVDSSKYIYVKTDKEGRLLYAIERNGNIKYGAGVPNQIKEYIAENLVEIIERIATKVDKVTGKSLIDAEFASSVEYVTNPKYIKADTDKDGRILGGYLEDGSKVLPGGTIIIPTSSKKFVEAFTDCLNKVILGFERDGNIYFGAGTPKQVKEYIGQQRTLIERRVNTRQISNIYNAARYDVGSAAHMYPNINKDFQIALAGDPHTGDFALNNIVELANKVQSIDGVLVLGDMNGWTPYDKYSNGNGYDVAGVEKAIERIFKGNSKKPFFFVCGNHDSGEGRCVMYCRTHEQVYNTFIKPMIDSKILKSGEYAVSGDYADRCYYYHDFDETKTRLIVLYEYGFPLELGENDYWEPITYDSTKGLIQPGTTYTYDANNPIVLNAGGYKEHSFRLIQTVTTLTASSRGNYRSVPYYKIRSRQIFTKNQIDWLISTLNSTPDGYGIVIASHQCLMAHTHLTDNKFSVGSNPNCTYKPRENGRSYDMLMDNNIIPKIIDAWKNKTSLSEKVAALDDVGDNQIASYLNVLEDGDYHYMYEVDVDFSSRTNNNAYFSNYINGHEHCDMIEKSKDFQGQLTVGVTTPNPPYRYMSDCATVKDENSPAYDSITVFACSKNRIALCKYGNDTTFTGIKRDFEIINPNDNN